MHKLTCLLLASLLSLPALAGQSRAEDSVFVYRAGDITVMRLADKKGGVPPSVLVGADKAMLDSLHGQVCPAMYLTFLIKTPRDLVLVDTGNGDGGQGRTAALLKELGIPKDAVTRIVLTHMHGDHVRGLFSKDAKAFPRAEVYVDEREFRFWSNRRNASRAPAGMAACFDNAERLSRLYKDSIRLFKAGDKVFPWLASVALPGHTEGHTGFVLEQAGRRLFLAGDFMHCLPVQTAHPDVAVIWDSDQELAKQTRLQTLRRTANTGTVVLGSHFPNPGGVLFKEDGGRFSYEFVQPEAR